MFGVVRLEEYIAPKTLADDYTYKKLLNGDRLFIDTICNAIMRT